MISNSGWITSLVLVDLVRIHCVWQHLFQPTEGF